MAAGKGVQFTLLLWKNWLMQKRKKLLTCFEIGLPTLLSLVLLLIRLLVKVEDFNEPTSWDEFEVDTLYENLKPFSPPVLPPSLPPGFIKWQLAYAPNNTVVMAIMQDVAKQLDCQIVAFDLSMNGTGPPTSKSLGFSTEEEMVKHLHQEDASVVNVLAGITFTSNFPENDLPTNFTYKIRRRSEQYFSSIRFNFQSRWFTDFVFPEGFSLGPREKNETEGGAPGYYREGFLGLQRALDVAIIHQINNTAATNKVKLAMRRFPYPPYREDPYTFVPQLQLPLIVLLSFMVTAPNIAKDLVLEKERKLKETMKIMGLNNWLHWLAWFTKYFMFLLISVLLMTLFYHIKIDNKAVINYGDPSLTFVFLLAYSVTVIIFCFMVSVFFSKANSGANACGILFFIAYVPYFFLSSQYSELSYTSKILSSLSLNVAMSYGCVQIAEYEGSTIGLKWSNIGSAVKIDDDFSMAHVLMMLLVDSVIYGFITWYVDAVFPGDYGIPNKWYFLLTKTYWCGSNSNEPSCENGVGNMESQDEADYGHNADMHESNPSNLNAGIKIRKLRKEFRKDGSDIVAVNDISLDMFEGQITALLGHNGAGKTTTMFMLTGFIPPNGGNAFINGHDICNNISKVRSSLGWCPQHDVLFDTLTVEEHLMFFAKMKGVSGSDVKTAVTDMISLLHLEKKTNAQAKSLSGGMKRKLCVGIALIGDSKVVILDEPTSGMDPEARRQTWDILQSQREGRTMLLTTHFMDEADLLGDRIAIMSEGVVKCCGSSLYLKSKYGVGYHMVMVKTQSCDVDEVTKIINKHVPEAKLESNISAELSYILPHESSDKFEALFSILEDRKTDLGISSFGASVTTMEEVFLRVGESVDEEIQERLQQGTNLANGYENKAYSGEGHHYENGSRVSNKKTHVECTGTPKGVKDTVDLKPVFETSFARNSGCSLYMQQFRGMLEKRVIYSWRNKVLTIYQLLLPVFFAIISCTTIASNSTGDPPQRSMSLSMFKTPVTPFLENVTSSTSPASGIGDAFKGVIQQVSSVDEINDPVYKDVFSMDNYLADVSVEEKERYLQSYMAAGTIQDTENGTSVVSWFNNEALHSSSVSLELMGNALLQYFTGSTQYTINAINHPLPPLESTKAQQELDVSTTSGFIVAYNLTSTMAFLIGTFAVFLVKERVVKAKHSQFVSGVHVFNFWVSTFTWDLINYMLPTFGVLCVLAAFNIEGYIAGSNAGYVILIFVLYAWAVLPYTYLLSFLFSVPASACAWCSVLNILVGTASVIAVQILEIPQLELVEVGEVLRLVFLSILPNYCYFSSLEQLYRNHQSLQICDALDIDTFCVVLEIRNETNACCPDNCGDDCAITEQNYLAWESPGIGKPLVFLAIQGVVLFGLLFFAESGTARRLMQAAVSRTLNAQKDRVEDDEKSVPLSPISHLNLQEDDDVVAERERVHTSLDTVKQNEAIILYNVKKYYGAFLAVDGLSLGIPQGECFGLLGVNGAGKTTTFKMLTGDETLSGGNAYIQGNSVQSNIKEVQQKVGYCPQFDALIDQMTVKETLRMFSRLRGVAESDITSTINTLIEGLLLRDHVNKQCQSLSGGNKRKLSTAIALVGEPPVVFLDEPTTGMDPVARRLLWDTLTKVRASGRTLILTSHSMEECEALCTRIAIMVNGQFKCLGSPQHLKNKFGEGYTLMAKVKGTESEEIDSHTNNLMRFIEESFPSCSIKDLHQGLVHYQVKREGISWAQLFGTMERAKDEYHIEDYSVSQTTLEQVFINFARAQEPPHEESMTCGRKTRNCCRFFCCCQCRKV